MGNADSQSVPHVQHHTFLSVAVKSKVSFRIYIPEAYDSGVGRGFPVLYWLHGYMRDTKRMAAVYNYVSTISGHFDRAIRGGKIPPMLVVFPNGLGDSMWCDSKDGSVPMETIVAKELIPYVDANFRTIAARQGRLIEGPGFSCAP
jgi:enterochelin esterase-like enzyme